jgi:hypothetical protein
MATYYINMDSGSDSTGTGTALLPWKTISKAYSMSTTGDTIYLQASSGLYVPVGIYNRTLTAASLGSAVIDGTGLNSLASGGTVYVNNLKLQNMVGAYEAGFFKMYGGTWTFTNTQFHNYSDPSNGGIFYSRDGWGGSSYTLNMTRCFFTGNITATFGAIAGSYSHSSYVNLCNCVFYHQTTDSFSGVGALFFNIVATLKNNIFVNLKPATTIPFRYSGYGSATGDHNCKNGLFSYMPSGTGDITSDPMFVDAANNNFNLRPASPCIGTGTPI